MKKNIPPFDERFFLLALLFDYQIEKGTEIRHLDKHGFSILPDGRLATWLPELVENKKEKLVEPEYSPFDGGYVIKSNAIEWFKEAECLGYVKAENRFQYVFTMQGYQKALEYYNASWSKSILNCFKGKPWVIGIPGALWAIKKFLGL